MSELERYRPTMDDDVVRSWAEDANKRIEELKAIVADLAQELGHFVVCHIESLHIDHHDIKRARDALARARGTEGV